MTTFAHGNSRRESFAAAQAALGDTDAAVADELIARLNAQLAWARGVIGELRAENAALEEEVRWRDERFAKFEAKVNTLYERYCT